LAEELRCLHAMGAPPLQCLRSATTIPAMATGMQNVKGSIEPGKVADIVALWKNPLEDDTAYRSIALVVRNGKIEFNCLSGKRHRHAHSRLRTECVPPETRR
ncbi:MAG: amidohydrolase family protein, partial [Planctomycetota bacterium]|nr:amidohydrolase family protein [Planctomycetota bacterium]